MSDTMRVREYLRRIDAGVSLAAVYLAPTEYRYDPSSFLVLQEEFRRTSVADLNGFTAAVRTLAYSQFLRSVYWAIVRAWVSYCRRDKCENCSSQLFLETHHKTYLHLGAEWRHTEDLELLCNGCHSAKHGLKGTKDLANPLRPVSQVIGEMLKDLGL